MIEVYHVSHHNDSLTIDGKMYKIEHGLYTMAQFWHCINNLMEDHYDCIYPCECRIERVGQCRWRIHCSAISLDMIDCQLSDDNEHPDGYVILSRDMPLESITLNCGIDEDISFALPSRPIIFAYTNGMCVYIADQQLWHCYTRPCVKIVDKVNKPTHMPLLIALIAVIVIIIIIFR